MERSRISHILFQQIQLCQQTQSTGVLLIKNDPNYQWSLSFYKGRLMCANSPLHSQRRWSRQVHQHGPEPKKNIITYGEVKGYSILNEHVKRGQLERTSMAFIIEGCATEILFDILQHAEKHFRNTGKSLKIEAVAKENTQASSVLIRTDQVLQQTLKRWNDWKKADLVNYSPNMAPTICKPDALQKQVTPAAYQRLVSLTNSQLTLRDLAVKLKTPLLSLTQSLIPYIQRGSISLTEIGDLPDSTQRSSSIKPERSSANPSGTGLKGKSINMSDGSEQGATPSQAVSSTGRVATPRSQPIVNTHSSLIAYIDDSQTDGQAMEKILSTHGYRLLHIQDPIQALPLLLEHKPQLIFLDLLMPVVNGYEICAQIRRISNFQQTPIIILTSNNGITDRLRAKVVDATGFLSKPIQSDKVLKVLDKYFSKS